MPAGRPTKLTEEAIEKAQTYIDGGYIAEGDKIPSVVGLADTLGVVAKTLYNWGESSDTFLHILEKCNQRQHRVLVNGGLSGDLNAAITKLVLGKHGYHERQEHTGAEGKDLVPENMTISVLPVKVVKKDGDPSS